MTGLSIAGFGWSFYGFFLAAGLWMAVYFVWSFHAARRERGE